MEALFHALPALLEALPDNEMVREAVVFAAWRRCAGEQLVEHTCPVKFEENRLTVAVADKSWQKNLASLASQMIFKINAVLGSAVVTYIEFVIDAKKLKSGKVQNLSHDGTEGSADAEVTPELMRAAAAITDEKMRREFLAAAAGCTARRNRLIRRDLGIDD